MSQDKVLPFLLHLYLLILKIQQGMLTARRINWGNMLACQPYKVIVLRM